MSSAVRHTLLDTPLGWIGLAWNDAGVVRLQLPAADRAATERALLKRLDSTEMENLPAPIAETVALIRRYAAGEAVDFSAVPVAAALAGKLGEPGQRVGIVLSGGNVDLGLCRFLRGSATG